MLNMLKKQGRLQSLMIVFFVTCMAVIWVLNIVGVLNNTWGALCQAFFTILQAAPILLQRTDRGDISLCSKEQRSASV